MHVRSYRRDDLEALFALDRLCFAAAFRFSRTMMRRCAEDPAAITRLAVEPAPTEKPADRLLGFVIVQIERTAEQVAGYLVTLDVDPEARRRGVGRTLLAHAEREAAMAGAAVMLLHVHTGNETALQLYESTGYRRLQLERSFYGRGLDAFVYRKELLAPAGAEYKECQSPADSAAPRSTDAS